ncbi:hypothetical protein [Ruminococcus sp.]|uniref:hypothetical protein n=1 Tax=Ruminococcus sp. TaxID=41978 RepID=UPI00388F2699
MEIITGTMRTKAWFYHFTDALYKNGTISEQRRTELKNRISLMKVQDKGNGNKHLPNAAC